MSLSTPGYRTGRAIAAIVIAVFALSLGDTLIKAAGLSLPIWQMFALRSLIAVPVMWWIAQRHGPITPQGFHWVALRSIFMVTMWVVYYVSLSLIPLSVAAAAYYTGPLFIVALAAVVERRWPRPRALIAILAGFIGVLLVIRPDASGFHIAALLPLISAVLYACAMVLTSAKCRTENPYVLALGLNIAFAAAGLLMGLFSGQEGSVLFGPWQPITANTLMTILALAVIILIASAGAAIAYQEGPPATIAAFDYGYLVFAILWGVVIFDELLGPMALIGSLLILGAGLLALPSRRRRSV